MNMDSSVNDANMVYTGDDPWYLRTLPGRTGDFMGHFIPALCFFSLGLGLLLLALFRARNLPSGKSFAELHIPESDPLFLKFFGMVNMAGTTVGIIYEIYDKDPGFDSTAFTHASLYTSFFIVGICALYESKGRLPLDTHRAALVVACIVQALIWYAHGSMKKMPADGALHIYLSYLNWGNAAAVAYSMRYNDSVIAFLAGWAFLLLQGLWIFVAGLYECCVDLHMHDVAAILAMLCLVTLLSIILAVVHLGPKPSDQQLAKFRGNFSILNSSDGDGDYDVAVGTKATV
ncbi:expressed unknown protein [Seminavis robusta]|uniref:Uncharacterized protein n=1 Tax=Seminavis robusta TaxID=568900 RepID=A0A9N8HG04_9STRA|nr:expressed unknown protein [Seminavis robusta]|eukprot:Sro459_g147380.1 n/a (289) ;mRNA; r:58108-58974